MASDTPASPDEAASGGRASPGKGNSAKIPKRIHKAVREKQKREHLNDLFQDLADTLELTQPNNGKASILSEASRLLKEIFGQIESLKKENVSLLSESSYVTIEKDELKEENSTLGSQIEKLQDELRSRAAGSKPDLNAHPPIQYQQQQPEFPGSDPLMQQPPAVLIVPILPDIAPGYPKETTHVRKPHARYPTQADSWPSQLLLREHTDRRLELQLESTGNLISSNRDEGPD